MTIRAMVVDDEPLARERVRSLLAAEADVELVAEAGDGKSAVAAVLEHQPDLIFLDVQMPGLDGFAVLRALPADALPATIFVTAFDRYAIRAFEVNALDYLLKPFSPRRFKAALDRARQELEKSPDASATTRLRTLLQDLENGRRYQRQLVIKSGGRIVFLRVEEVDCLEAEGNYVRVHAGSMSYLIRETMKNMETRLDPDQFVRIHRSTIVQADRIKELQPLTHGEYAVILRDGRRLTASRGPDNRLRRLIDAGVLRG
ncbi:MAG: LytTR family DNA-binding domain-containing protein [Vicinamibacterales bacterium]